MLCLICAANAHALDSPWQPIQVEIRGEPGHYQLYRDGKPYEVRGAGVSVVASDVGQLFQRLKAHGGNSLRTWSVGDGQILDLAHELELSVALCLDVKRERHGFDYNDAVAVRQQFEQLEQKVRKFRNHPALLAWIIGNELNHDFSIPRVYDAVNEIPKMIHALYPAHPTTTTTAGINSELASIIAARAPDLDFLSVQVMEESRATQTGGDPEEVPPDRSEYLSKQDSARVEVRAPQQPGPYRLFVYVHDEAGAVAHGNIPFLVEAPGS